MEQVPNVTKSVLQSPSFCSHLFSDLTYLRNPYPDVVKYPSKSLRGESETGTSGLAPYSLPPNAKISF